MADLKLTAAAEFARTAFVQKTDGLVIAQQLGGQIAAAVGNVAKLAFGDMNIGNGVNVAQQQGNIDRSI